MRVNRGHLFSTGIFINDRKVRSNPFSGGNMLLADRYIIQPAPLPRRYHIGDF